MKQTSQTALSKLQQPFLPLARLIQILFLAGPFDKIDAVLAELNEPIECQCNYNDPQAAAAPYLAILRDFEFLKNNEDLAYIVLDEKGQELDRMEALDLWICQQIISLELAEINSLLCGSEHCDLCCIGPRASDKQEFFEIPLQDDERTIFPVPQIDSSASRSHMPNDDKSLPEGGLPFYQREDPAIFHWRKGWSLILPRLTKCPQLDDNGRCVVYPRRPSVCRKPQIFPYLLEPTDQGETSGVPVYIARRKLLAVWDCPYVQKFQDQIADYADLCGTEAIFKENKA
jgi:Fe-S-cluster containining protein